MASLEDLIAMLLVASDLAEELGDDGLAATLRALVDHRYGFMRGFEVERWGRRAIRHPDLVNATPPPVDRESGAGARGIASDGSPRATGP